MWHTSSVHDGREASSGRERKTSRSVAASDAHPTRMRRLCPSLLPLLFSHLLWEGEQLNAILLMNLKAGFFDVLFDLADLRHYCDDKVESVVSAPTKKASRAPAAPCPLKARGPSMCKVRNPTGLGPSDFAAFSPHPRRETSGVRSTTSSSAIAENSTAATQKNESHLDFRVPGPSRARAGRRARSRHCGAASEAAPRPPRRRPLIWRDVAAPSALSIGLRKLQSGKQTAEPLHARPRSRIERAGARAAQLSADDLGAPAASREGRRQGKDGRTRNRAGVRWVTAASREPQLGQQRHTADST